MNSINKNWTMGINTLNLDKYTNKISKHSIENKSIIQIIVINVH